MYDTLWQTKRPGLCPLESTIYDSYPSAACVQMGNFICTEPHWLQWSSIHLQQFVHMQEVAGLETKWHQILELLASFDLVTSQIHRVFNRVKCDWDLLLGLIFFIRSLLTILIKVKMIKHAKSNGIKL